VPKRPPWEAIGATKPPHLTIVPNAPAPTNSVAKAILNAGCKRRGEEEKF
jgi:hypothetical protein